MRTVPPYEKRGPATEAPGRVALALVLIAVVAALVYSNTLSSPFIFDDENNIVYNYGLRDLSNLWPPSGTRYLGYLSFALNYAACGLEAACFHATNIIVHIINSSLLFLLLLSLFATPRLAGFEGEGRGGPGRAGFAVALAASLIFASHPLQTSAVTYITQRFASLATLFYLLSALAYVRWRLGAEKGPAARWALYAASLGAAVAAQKTKEISFTLPFMLVIIEVLFFTPADGAPLKKRALGLFPFILTALIIPLTVFGPWGSGPTLAGLDVSTHFQQLKDIEEIPRYDYLVTQFRVVATYMRLMLLPAGQNLDYDYPVYTTLAAPAVLLSLALHIAVIAFSFCLLRAALRRRDALLFLVPFGVFWFYLTLSIESSVIPIKDVIFEHRVYLPGAGAYTAFTSGAFFLYHGLRRRKGSAARFAAVFIILTVLPLGAAAHMRNRVWKDPLTMYADIVEKSPEKARARHNLAVVYRDSGRIELAVSELKEAVRLDPEDDMAHYTLAGIYFDQGLAELAAKEYGRALELRPDNVYARNNLANILFMEGRLNEAYREYRAVIEAQPGHIEAHFNLALVSERLGLAGEAAALYRKFISIAPPEEYGAQMEEARRRIYTLGGGRQEQ